MRCPTLAELPPPPPERCGWPWTEETRRLSETMPDGSPWPRISILTPSYNQGEFIEETIRSVLLQGYLDLEYIVIDGGSEDRSVEIIRRYEPWLTHWVSERDRGQSHAINKGFAECTGDIITWVSADDVYLPGAFYKVGSRWPDIAGYGAVVGAFHFTDENSRVSPEKHAARLPHPAPIDLTLSTDWRLHQVSTFYLREALDDVGRCVREDLRYNMDRELIYRIARKHRIFLHEDALAAFRIQSQSKSWSVSSMLKMAREYADLQYLFLTEDERENAQRERIARQCVANGYVKYGKYSTNVGGASIALVKALSYHPRLAMNRGYWKAWMQAWRLLPAVRLAKTKILRGTVGG